MASRHLLWRLGVRISGFEVRFTDSGLYGCSVDGFGHRAVEASWFGSYRCKIVSHKAVEGAFCVWFLGPIQD